jgi:hypothetical protein
MARLRRLLDFLRSSKSGADERYDAVKTAERLSDVPSDTGSTIFLVKKDRRPVWAAFMCPCGAGHRLVLNLSKLRSPYWTVKVRDGRATVYPSISLGQGCQSHFWIWSNKVYWAKFEDD